MHLVSIENTRLIELFIAGRPEGQLPAMRAIPLLIERYKFRGFPTKLDEIGESIKFAHGEFEEKPIEAFDIHRDGVVISST